MTELGEIPEEWEVKSLSEISSKIGDGLHGTPQYVENGIYYFINGNNLSNGKITINDDTKMVDEIQYLKNNKNLNNQSILISLNGTIGNLACYNYEKVMLGKSSGYITLRSDMNRAFIYYVLGCERIKNYFYKELTGTTIKNLSLETLRKTLIAIPSVEEQEKIASILSTVDEQIDIVDGLIEKNKELKKGLIQQLLTKGIGHTKFKKSEVGKIPEEWEVKKLYEVCVFSNGKAHENDICESGRYIVVNSKFISTDGIVQKYSDQNICPLSKGDIVMVMSDVPNGRAIGKCYLINEDNRYTLNQRICSLKTLNMDNEFLFYYLNRNKYFLKYDDGVKQTNLRKDEVLDCPVVMPSLKEQNKIAEILSSIDLKIDIHEAKKQKLEELKTGLMQQLLTGKLRVM